MLKKIRVFYKPSLHNDFNWKLREFVSAEIDSESGVKEVYVETFRKTLSRKGALSVVHKAPDKDKKHDVTWKGRQHRKQLDMALKGLMKIDWKTQNGNSFILKGQRY